MEDIYDYEVDFEELCVPVKYDFYCEYIGHNHFREQFEKRKEYIIDKYTLDLSDNDLIKNYFVEIFSWSVIPRKLLFHIRNYLKLLNISSLIDPCCGNGFHTFLFDNFTGINTLSCDNQKEQHSWLDIIEKDGMKFLEDLNDKEHQEGALILSWIEGNDLAIKLLNKYYGDVVISIGNYKETSPGFYTYLNHYYECKKRFILEMPWGLKENIEIYKLI